MRRTAATVAAGIVGLCAGARAVDDRPATTALLDELERRFAAREFGVRYERGRTSLCSAISWLGGRPDLSCGFLTGDVSRVPPVLRAAYPAEFRDGTADDLSDLVDAYLPEASDALLAEIERRLAYIDAQIALAAECGHGGNPRGVARLVRARAAGIAKRDAAEGAATPLRRHDLLVAARDALPSAFDIQTFGLGPPDLGARSETSFRWLRYAVAPSYDPDLDADETPDVTATLADGRLVLTAEETIADRDGTATFTLALVADGVTGPGTYAFTSAEFGVRLPGDVSGVVLPMENGRWALRDVCPDRVAGSFTLVLRDGRRRRTVRGTFSAAVTQ